MALDFAVTSPLQLAGVHEASQTQLAAAVAMEAHKLADRSTAALCEREGIVLKPVVAENFCGWGPVAQKVIGTIAQAYARRKGLTVGAATNQIYEGLSTKTMRANARSLLARVDLGAGGAPMEDGGGPGGL